MGVATLLARGKESGERLPENKSNGERNKAKDGKTPIAYHLSCWIQANLKLFPEIFGYRLSINSFPLASANLSRGSGPHYVKITSCYSLSLSFLICERERMAVPTLTGGDKDYVMHTT